jgi:hypothetical protein
MKDYAQHKINYREPHKFDPSGEDDLCKCGLPIDIYKLHPGEAMKDYAHHTTPTIHKSNTTTTIVYTNAYETEIKELIDEIMQRHPSDELLLVDLKLLIALAEREQMQKDYELLRSEK